MIENSNGSYTIFTRGVDRITKTLDAVVAETFLNNPFIASDNLWSSFQNGIAEFVSQSGGMISDTDFTTYRPNWQTVKDVLQGNSSSEVLGCQN